ncbi:ATP-binding cassette domain-containing protein [Hoyosella rhizosphaerae]|uniref:ABC transporter ATP-binding protein n=1 Tax=Hoyosella rhizosphaerae TaxID=1755582 RepID=A0A916U1L8_9ACTN|nr:ATP-binding cassette domain-containing protein [Hoyosella rhizosphaerae]MBN4926698.1 ATP-binding cassette domain-containing protein [Hoyosella rhizosphaerae]GGC57116.1 ABC transporter ATP-binding protein [Hoyosella rhizosphaerae]
MLSARNITVRYGANTVLSDADFDLKRGEIVGLTGESGSGKTTLARVLTGLTTPQNGTVTIAGQHLKSAPRGHTALIFQSPRNATNPRHTLARVISEPARLRGTSSPDDTTRLAEAVGLTQDLLERRPHEVSDGQLQRACVARAFAQQPQFVVCDEATAMLDAATTAAIVRALVHHGTTHNVGVLLISHDNALLRACTSRIETLAVVD